MGRTECDNCAFPDTDLVAVHRVYITPYEDGTSRVDVLEETEWWCVPCVTQYPNQPV